MNDAGAPLKTRPKAGTVVFISGIFAVSTGKRRKATGGAYRDRTDDPLLAKQVLSQLS